MIKFRYYLSCIFFLLIIPSYAYLEEKKILIDQLENALQKKDKNVFLNLFYLEKEEQKEKINKFIKNYFDDFPYKEVYIAKSEVKEIEDNYLGISVIFLSGSDCVIEFWELSIKKSEQKSYIENIYVRNVITNIRRSKLQFQEAEKLKNAEFNVPDTSFYFKEAYLFKDGSENRSSYFILIGKGEFLFTPSVEFEKQQMKNLVGTEFMKDKVEYIIGIIRPQNIYNLLKIKEKVKVKPPAPILKKAMDIWNEQKELQSSVKWLQEISSDAIWDYALEMNTVKIKIQAHKFGSLTYNYFPNLPYTIHLYKEHPRKIYALYNPLQRGGKVLKFNIEYPFSVLFYNIDIFYEPLANYFKGTAILTIRSNFNNLNFIELHLNESLFIKGIWDENNNYLLFFKNKQDQLINIYLKNALKEKENLKIRIDYEGSIKPMEPFQDFIRNEATNEETSIFIKPINFYEGNFYWYPQSILPEFSKARITITLPKNYIAFATGKFVAKEERENFSKFNFNSYIPTKHLSLMITEDKDVKIIEDGSIRIFFEKGVDTSSLIEQINRIINYYEEIIGERPYPTLDIYYHWDDYKGGYSQAGFIILVDKHPLIFKKKFKGEHPLDFPQYKDFYLAHEIAHQWCGQALAWLTYQDQWMSEGIAQYLAAKYIEHSLGKEASEKLLERFAKTVKDKYKAGPIILGKRLSALDNKNEAYGAIVYNKSAIMLKMIEDIIGSKIFLNLLKEFYNKNKFSYITTYDLIESLKKTNNLNINDFFKNWFFSSDIPQLNIKKYMKSSGILLQITTTPNFTIPLSILLKYKDGSVEEKQFVIEKEKQEFRIDSEKPINRIEIKNIYPFKLSLQ